LSQDINRTEVILRYLRLNIQDPINEYLRHSEVEEVIGTLIRPLCRNAFRININNLSKSFDRRKQEDNKT